MKPDPSQKKALDSCTAPCRVSVLGAPGTGKTFLMAHLVAREVQKGKKVALLTPDRKAAGELVNLVTRELGSLPETVSVQSIVAFAYALVSSYAHILGRKPPELITGPDEDAILADILNDPEVNLPFPKYVTEEVRAQAVFRSQIRDLITRASELGLDGQSMQRLGRQRNETMWIAGGELMELYEDVLTARDALAGSSDAPDRLDHAHLVKTAGIILSQWDKEDEVGRPTRPMWDWVVVDDIQNAPRSVLALLEQLAADGASIVVAGDPDSAVQGFRGGSASLPGEVSSRGFTPVALRNCYRGGANIAGLSRSIEENIRVAGGAIIQRAPQYFHNDDEVRALRFTNTEEEAAGITGLLRRAHIERGIPYSSMAVMTRSRSMHPIIRASLVRREIPVESLISDKPLREQSAVAELLTLVRFAMDPQRAENVQMMGVLSGRLISISPLRMRQIGRILRGHEALAQGKRRESELIRSVLCAQEQAPQGAEELEKVAEIITKIRSALEDGAQAEEVLWAAWEACDKVEEWRNIALGKGVQADNAHADLDAIMQLFRVAQRLADRSPNVTIYELLEELDSHQLPEDSIARVGALADAVCLTTPNASMGREWEYVVIAGLQDGLWPNMSFRDSLTHTSDLAQLVLARETEGLTHTQERQALVEEILDDELRQFFHAVTRSTGSVILTCVDSEDHIPSRFFSLAGYVREEDVESERVQTFVQEGAMANTPEENIEDKIPRKILEMPRPTLDEFEPSTLVAELRRTGTEKSSRLLEKLASFGVIQAESKRWVDNLSFTPSHESPEEETVVLSPSRVEKLLECPLRAFLSDMGGEESKEAPEARIGTLVHRLAELFSTEDIEGLWEAFEKEWEELNFELTPLEYQRLRARAIASVKGLEAYLKDSQGNEEVLTEEKIVRKYGDSIIVRGSIDRLENDGQGVRVVDFKTGKAINKYEAEENLQLRLYQWALNRDDLQGARLVYLRDLNAKGQPKLREQNPLSDEAEESVVLSISEAASLLRGREYPAYPDQARCSNCSFALLCPAVQEGKIFS